MKLVTNYETFIYESSLKKFKTDLKKFQTSLNINVTIKELLNSIDAVELNFEDLFENVSKYAVLKSIESDKNLNIILDKLDLKIGIYNDSDILETLSRIPFRWRFIYNKDDSELEKPIYIIFKYYNKEWSDIKLYLVQDDVQKLLDTLSLITIELRYDDTKRWFYQSSNSGINWSLLDKVTVQDNIIASYIPTNSFKKKILYDDILKLAKHKDISVFIY